MGAQPPQPTGSAWQWQTNPAARKDKGFTRGTKGCILYTMKKRAEYTPPILTIDMVAFRIHEGALEVLLLRRNRDPFAGEWALPGGYSPAGQTTLESLEDIMRRKTGVSTTADLTYIEQLYTFDTVARDPRGHAVSVTYMGCGRTVPLGRGDSYCKFWPIDQLPALAYDHADIIVYARERLGAKLTYTTVAAALLPDAFTLSQLQTLYEAVLGRPLDRRNFRKKFLSLGVLRETGDMWREGAHRPARLFAFTDPEVATVNTLL